MPPPKVSLEGIISTAGRIGIYASLRIKGKFKERNYCHMAQWEDVRDKIVSSPLSIVTWRVGKEKHTEA